MKVTVVSPLSMKTVVGLATPRDFYWVLEHPAPLAGMVYPSSSPWQTLASEGFKSIVCLTDATARYDPNPLDVLRAAKFKDLYGGTYPDEPAREQSASETSSRRSSRKSFSAKALSSIARAAPARPAPS